MIGDQQSATLGLQVLPGHIKITYGTGCFLMKNTGAQIEHRKGLLSTVNLQLGPDEKPTYGLESAVESGAAILNYFRENLNLIEDFETADAKILQKIQNKSSFFYKSEKIKTNCGTNSGPMERDIFANETLLVPSLNSTLFSPFWESGIQGQLSNLNFAVGKTEIYAATLESFCFRVKQCLDVMDLPPQTDIIIDGGVTRNEYLVHFQANLLQNDLNRVRGIDGTIRGVFLGCLAYLNRKTFASVLGKKLQGTLIRATPDEAVVSLLRSKFARFDGQVRQLILSRKNK